MQLKQVFAGVLTLTTIAMGTWTMVSLEAAIAQDVPPNTTETFITNLTGTNWKLVRLGTLGNLSEPISGIRSREAITAQFYENDNTVFGTGGCNFYGGTYQTNGNTLVFPDGFDQTAMGCEIEINNQEERYLNALARAQSYQINEQGQLTIFYQINSETGVLIFEPTVKTIKPTQVLSLSNRQELNNPNWDAEVIRYL